MELIQTILSYVPEASLIIVALFMWYLYSELREIKAHHMDCHKHVSNVIRDHSERIGFLEGKMNGKK